MNRAIAPGYDLFKLIVTIVLVVILVLMLLRGCATPQAAPMPTKDVGSPFPTEALVSNASTGDATPSVTPSATPTTVPATVTATEAPATPTTAPAAEATLTPTPEPATTDATPTTVTDTTSCNTRVPTRLSVGQAAQILQRLNLRNEASITAPILQTNSTGTRVEIIGGPICTPVGERAYLWWQIRLPDGAEGWSAEMQLNEPSYLLQPVS